MINNRKSPIQDDYIEKYLAEKELNLTATLDAKAAYSDADFVVIAAPAYLLSSLLNRSYNGRLTTYTGFIFACNVFIYFAVPWIAIGKKGSKRVVQASWNCLMFYWIPSIITVFAQGRNVIDNANNVYFIGNKFNVAYLNVVMLCLLLFLNNERKENCSRSFVLKIALVTVFTTILQVFVDSGLGTALIQKKDADDLDFSSVFYFNFFVCIVLYIGMFLAAPIIAGFYSDSSLIPIIRVISLKKG